MSTTVTQSWRRTRDHFEPHDIDPLDQRRLRGQLEQIDYAAFISNREVLGQTLGPVDMERLQRLSVAAASARARWVSEALAMSEAGRPVTTDQGIRLQALRATYEELAEAYEGLRRMVERGYLSLPGAPAA